MTTPRPDDLDALPGIVISTIRTITPYLVGWLIAAALWIARPLGLDLPEGAAEYLTGTLPILLGSIYYMAARKLEARWPGVPWLGSRTQPVYPRRAADDDDGHPDAPDWEDDEDDPYFVSESTLREIDRQRE